jgi:hypothetical protein
MEEIDPKNEPREAFFACGSIITFKGHWRLAKNTHRA